IRDWSVTGVQTCALPISVIRWARWYRRPDSNRHIPITVIRLGGGAGTGTYANRYLSHACESAANSLCLAWRLTCRGCRASVMPASCGVRLPLWLLQGKQHATRFSQVDGPRLDRGIT